MKRILKPVWFCVLVALGTASRAATVNDGTTTAGLQRLANAYNFLGDVNDTTLTSGANGFLTAAQLPDLALPPLRTVWYATETVPTNGVYRVAADFRPAQFDPPNPAATQGGIMGWLNLSTSQGIVLKIDPAGATLQVSVVNFSAAAVDENESLTNLYNLDGTAATADLNSASADLTASYVGASFATVELNFTSPSAADQTALTNTATAHVTARAFQSPDGTNPPVQLGQTLELLTDLPLPLPTDHRFGYFAVWATPSQGDVIGDLDNLEATGGIIQSIAPTVTLVSPKTDAVFADPAAITLEADARDTDGTITRVDFFSGATLLGSAGTVPYSFLWTNVPVGSYVLTAMATDNTGLRTTSDPVSVSVQTPPSVTLTNPAGGASFSAPATIDISAEVGIDVLVQTVDFFAGATLLGTVTGEPFAFTWNNVAAGDYALTARATADSGLMSTSAPVQIHVTGGTVTPPTITVATTLTGFDLSWGSTGFQLLFRPDLSSGVWRAWPEDTTTLTRITIPFSAGVQFYQLSGAGTPTGPELQIQVSGGLITISWPTSVTGYELQATPTLTPAEWAAVVTTGNTYSAPATGSSRFFRLAPR
jgi:hypothetical protein